MSDDLLTSEKVPQRTARNTSKNRQRMVLLISIGIALAAWLYGYFTSDVDVLPLVSEVLPGTTRVETQGKLFIGYNQDGDVIGYAASGTAPGYAGPIEMLVGINPEGEIVGTRLVQQSETPGFFRLIVNAGLVEQLQGQPYSGTFQLGQDIDAVSGATFSAEGVAGAARDALRTIAREGLDSPLPPEKKAIKFGWPEITLIALYAVGYLGSRIHNGKLKRRIRWGTLLTGLVVLGFIYTAPLTIAQIITLLSGYWPEWQSNLYWYILIGGILFATTLDSKNPYCAWFCPFGAFQEVLAQVTNAKLYKPREWREVFTWAQRGLAFIAVIMGLALRKPGVAGYEPFATLFDLKGTTIEFIFLIMIMLASLLMYRPFCNYLCPLDPVYDLIAEVRRWVVRSDRNEKRKTD